MRLDAETTTSISNKPVYLSLFGIWSKKSGYAVSEARRRRAGDSSLLADKSVERLSKAADAPVFDYVSETFEESPNIFVGRPRSERCEARDRYERIPE